MTAAVEEVKKAAQNTTRRFRRPGVSEGPLVCRQCGRTPESRGDQVSERAIEYLCSRCLMGLTKAPAAQAPPERPGHTDIASSGNPSPQAEISQADNAKSTTSEADKSLRSVVLSRRSPGRPRVAASVHRQKAAARQKAFRARQKEEATV